MYQRQPDLILRGGSIVDGTGAPRYYADVAVRGARIDYIGDLRGMRAPLEIDARGKFVTPGFIDSHSHADATIWGNPECQSLVRQGITTAVVGNCGFSKRTFLDGVAWDPKGADIQCVYNLPGPDYPKGSMAAVLDRAEGMGTSLNTAWLCGHNDLRVLAGLYTADYTEAQFAVMAGFLREAMEAGFIGLSTGLEFVPGILSRPEEVERLAAVAGEYDANYASHMRDEGTYILEAVEEFLNVIRKTGLRGTISHLNVKYDNGVPNDYLQKAMQLLRDAREREHLNVLTDMLPTCFATGGALAILPPWLYEDGWDRAREILADPAGRKRVKADCDRYWRFLAAGQWDRLLYIQPPYQPELCTRPFGELAQEAGRSPFDYFLDVMQAAPTLADAERVHMQGTVFHEQTMIESVVRDPLYLWMTDSMATVEDGPLARNTANLQEYMSMTYFFTRYVRDLKVISLEQALMKVCSVPARHYRLTGRGVLAEGYYADLNVFDLDALEVRATFADICRYCAGMDYVIVNGQPVIAQGRHTGARPGQVLRHLPAR